MTAQLNDLYRPSLTLLTDLYQLTMMYGYWKQGLWDTGAESCFHLFYRRAPFGGSHAIACGIEPALDWLEGLEFSDEDLDYLTTLTGNDGQPLFETGFIQRLADFRFRARVYAVREGETVLPNTPILRVEGGIADCQLAETALLTIIGFQTLIATKAQRICVAADGDAVLEFGLRRAQGIDGGLAASRAAYVGGVAATSNVLAGRLYGIPVKGTHAHSWVMCFQDELDAFQRWAKAMPNNSVFLVDTYDTVRGVERAVEVARTMREKGHEMVGIRLDSGDLSDLSRKARGLLDANGFPDAAIVASNDLDEYRITTLKSTGATIGVWGVGTRLVTAYDQPALGGVYKLAGMRETRDDPWSPRIKLSEDPIKTSNPGPQTVIRTEGHDVIVPAGVTALPVRARTPSGEWVEFGGSPTEGTELLSLALQDGRRARPMDSLLASRERALAGRALIGQRPALAESLWDLKCKLMEDAR